METFFEVAKGTILGILLFVAIHTVIGILIEVFERDRLRRQSKPNKKGSKKC